MNRRHWLGQGLGLGAWLVTSSPRPARAETQSAAIVQPEAATPAAWTARAFAMRQQAIDEGDQPYGAVVVRGARIVGEAPSRVVTAGDPTAHAEIEAIRDAARRLGTRDLAGCLLVSSSRPCPMCEAAAHWSGISRLIYGADATDAGPPRLSRC